jgi:hypothetical protein
LGAHHAPFATRADAQRVLWELLNQSQAEGERDTRFRGHDSERAAIIYQHQAQGADTVITQGIDAHAAAELRQDGTWPEPASPTDQ